ncbi:DUF3634 family protein [Alkalilimnicola ehrlichii MLHE-1]|uniref:DUF3634 domain-containing protein n=1 Tax=Alkalilimnicola ehrlichii (strain ATCC BAA-1101 / DSM 17681 / MLHE-1) TaxID=187272 RepID=Q0A9V1_ALKEH|nr:DUF3634 family protein [Alkalilimnicola ehrlichii]ABI56386.1 hypothetical protein Mlg_1033 [Alkalilimnicola ehrlichii MLHE-1]
MVWFWLFALLLGVAAVVGVVRHHRVAFVIAFDGKGPAVRKGAPPPGFLAACRDVARMYGVGAGKVYGVREAGGLQLAFSRDLPERARQPLRNCWTPPPSGGPAGGAGGGARRAG